MHLRYIYVVLCKSILLYLTSAPGGSAGKESACNVEDLHLIPGLGGSLEEGKGYALHYSGLEHSMDYRVQGILQARILE